MNNLLGKNSKKPGLTLKTTFLLSLARGVRWTIRKTMLLLFICGITSGDAIRQLQWSAVSFWRLLLAWIASWNSLEVQVPWIKSHLRRTPKLTFHFFLLY